MCLCAAGVFKQQLLRLSEARSNVGRPVCTPDVRPEGDMLAPLGELVRGLQHLHQEGVNGCVPNQFEEEEVLQAFQTDGAQRWEPQEELCKPR